MNTRLECCQGIALQDCGNNVFDDSSSLSCHYGDAVSGESLLTLRCTTRFQIVAVSSCREKPVRSVKLPDPTKNYASTLSGNMQDGGLTRLLAVAHAMQLRPHLMSVQPADAKHRKQDGFNSSALRCTIFLCRIAGFGNSKIGSMLVTRFTRR